MHGIVCKIKSSLVFASNNRFDELDNYMNERSIVIASLRNTIEGAWAEWELQQLPSSAVQELQKVLSNKLDFTKACLMRPRSALMDCGKAQTCSVI
eukprot:scaffold124694_cov18-Tisochrysis_lutea.AAC.1